MLTRNGTSDRSDRQGRSLHRGGFGATPVRVTTTAWCRGPPTAAARAAPPSARPTRPVTRSRPAAGPIRRYRRRAPVARSPCRGAQPAPTRAARGHGGGRTAPQPPTAPPPSPTWAPSPLPGSTSCPRRRRRGDRDGQRLGARPRPFSADRHHGHDCAAVAGVFVHQRRLPTPACRARSDERTPRGGHATPA